MQFYPGGAKPAVGGTALVMESIALMMQLAQCGALRPPQLEPLQPSNLNAMSSVVNGLLDRYEFYSP
jgi:hypothetical protein